MKTQGKIWGIGVVAVAVMMCSFLPYIYAADSAALNLNVTFDIQPQVKIWTDPAGPFTVNENQSIKFRVILDGGAGLSAENLPSGAVFEFDSAMTTYSIPPHIQESWIFSWEPKFGQAQKEPYHIVFKVKSMEGVVSTELPVEVTVLPGEKVISIELNEASWSLVGVKLGEKKGNLDASGKPIHQIKNTGNVPAMVDIGYVPMPLYEIGPDGEHVAVVRPGLEPGLNVFATKVGVSYDGGCIINEPVRGPGVDYYAIPPEGKIVVGTLSVNPTEFKVDFFGVKVLNLLFYAPTAVSEGIKGMNTAYEIRAYEAIN